MPIYQYEDTRTTPPRMRELWRPMRLRDHVPRHLRRVVTAPALNFHGQQGLANLPEINAAKDAMTGLKEVEEKHGAGYIERTFGMSAQRIKGIWSKPAPAPPQPA